MNYVLVLCAFVAVAALIGWFWPRNWHPVNLCLFLLFAAFVGVIFGGAALLGLVLAKAGAQMVQASRDRAGKPRVS